MVDLYYWSVETLQKYGLMQYEISSFARVGYESKHNQVYWDRKPYKGFGMGACSFDGTGRFQNEKNLSKYLINALKGQDLTIAGDQLTQEEVRLEYTLIIDFHLVGCSAIRARVKVDGHTPTILAQCR